MTTMRSVSRMKVCFETSNNALNGRSNILIDSIAGQMRSLKTGAAPPKKRKQANNDDSSGSDTEGDVESESETDTDTDSDED